MINEINRYLLAKTQTYLTRLVKDSKLWILQEDRDSSHSNKKRGLAQRLEEENWVPNIFYTPQASDLNLMEACWNILKQRAR